MVGSLVAFAQSPYYGPGTMLNALHMQEIVVNCIMLYSNRIKHFSSMGMSLDRCKLLPS